MKAFWKIAVTVFFASTLVANIGQYHIEPRDKRSPAQKMHDLMQADPNMQPSEYNRRMEYYAYLDFKTPEEFAKEIGEQRVNRRSYQEMNADNFE